MHNIEYWLSSISRKIKHAINPVKFQKICMFLQLASVGLLSDILSRGPWPNQWATKATSQSDAGCP